MPPARLAALAALALTAAAGAVVAAPSSGDPEAGKAVFGANCGGCHTLAAAGSTGSAGPVLDVVRPAFQTVQRQVTQGGFTMPAFAASLTETQIADVAAFVSQATGAGQGASPTPIEAPRPALPRVLAVRVTPSGLRVSSRRVTAGRVTITLRNTTARSVRISVALGAGRALVRRISAGTERRLSVTLPAGARRIAVAGRSTVVSAITA